MLAVLLMGNVAASADDGGKLSFGLRQLVARQDHGRRTAGVQEQKVCVFVKFRVSEADSLLVLYHAEKVTQIGNVYIVNIPLSQVSALAADDKVERVEAQFGGRLMNDVTPQWVNSGAVYAGTGLPEDYDGRGVLVGIVDGGFDLTHPTFYATDGVTCRIKRLVDDYATDDETIGVPTPLGREYATEADILAKRHTADVGMEHGTHCLGIAAGVERFQGHGDRKIGIHAEHDPKQCCHNADLLVFVHRDSPYAGAPAGFVRTGAPKWIGKGKQLSYCVKPRATAVSWQAVSSSTQRSSVKLPITSKPILLICSMNS